MNLSILDTILAVSRCSSFQEAAEVLNYTPAVVSKQIARAEDELGVRLFFRGNKASGAAMTPECLAILDDLTQMKLHWDRIGNTLDAIRTDRRDSVVRIGLGQRTWNYREDEIIADFIQSNPDISVELVHGYTTDLLNSMAEGKLDGVFVAMQGKAEEQSFTAAFIEKHDCSFLRVTDLCQMYLAISDRHKLAQRDEADFRDFRDYSIAVNSDPRALGCEMNLQPFQELCDKYGMELHYTCLATADASAYRIAKNTNVAIPIPNNNLKFEGIKYIRLRDWTAPLTYYFASMNRGVSPALARFLASVRSFAEKHSEPDGNK